MLTNKPSALQFTQRNKPTKAYSSQRLNKDPFEQVSEEASASTYQEEFRPASVLAAAGKLRARPKLQSIQDIQRSKPKFTNSATPPSTATTKLDIDNKIRPAVWDSQYQVFPSPTFRPRYLS